MSKTKNQVKRLEKVFDLMGLEAQSRKCEAMQGILDEAESILKETESGYLRDAGIIAASQKVEHYEIST